MLTNNMSTPFAEHTPDDSSLSEYGTAIECISDLDCARTAYFNACADFAAKPGSKQFSNVEATIELHSETFRQATKTIMEDAPLAEYSRILFQLLTHQDATRVDFLNSVLGKNSLVKMGEQFELPDEDELDMEQEPTYKANCLLSFCAFFENGIIKDTELFVTEVGGSKAARTLERRAKLMEHAVDIGKIALGTALGMLVIRKRRDI
jgi:hypothetical protein